MTAKIIVMPIRKPELPDAHDFECHCDECTDREMEEMDLEMENEDVSD